MLFMGSVVAPWRMARPRRVESYRWIARPVTDGCILERVWIPACAGMTNAVEASPEHTAGAVGLDAIRTEAARLRIRPACDGMTGDAARHSAASCGHDAPFRWLDQALKEKEAQAFAARAYGRNEVEARSLKQTAPARGCPTQARIRRFRCA